MLAFIPLKRVILPAVAVVVCPLVFWVVFMWFFWRSSYTFAELNSYVFDGTSPYSARRLFLESTINLSLEGLVIGLGCGVVIAVGERLIPRGVTYDGYDLP